MALSFLGVNLNYIPGVLSNHPGIPIPSDGLLAAAAGLLDRREQMEPSLSGLSNNYTIGGFTGTGGEFLFGTSPDRFRVGLGQMINQINKLGALAMPRFLLNPFDFFKIEPETSSLTKLSLDNVDQWSISITNFEDAYQKAKDDHKFEAWSATLVDAEAATNSFWPLIAQHGLAYNLLMLKKVTSDNIGGLRNKFDTAWLADWDALATAGRLYAIDLSIFSRFPSSSVDKLLRFTPATVTLLQRDSVTKTLGPIAVRVAGLDDGGAQTFIRGQATNSAWLYALQAAKTSVTVYGIWLGHVYQWHIVTAALEMGRQNNLAKNHAMSKMLAPQTKHLLQFDLILLLLWKFIAPPSSFNNSGSFMNLIDAFAEGRNFFDDDPLATLERNGIKQDDFSKNNPWDVFPIVSFYLELWQATQDYVGVVVDVSYKTNQDVASDTGLQNWMKEAGQKFKGNVQGLPKLVTTTALKRLLTSLVYRVTMHGCSRLRSSLSPDLSYVANFPVCLQMDTIPGPQVNLTTAELLKYMPKTGTIGLMTRFYGIFIYSVPYEPLIPNDGIDTHLYYSDLITEPRNQALIQFRTRVKALMQRIQPQLQQIHQWPAGIET